MARAQSSCNAFFVDIPSVYRLKSDRWLCLRLIFLRLPLETPPRVVLLATEAESCRAPGDG